jgi:hypothetical protein
MIYQKKTIVKFIRYIGTCPLEPNVATRPAIYSIISILVTMPVSSAINERYFSGIRRVKSYLRSTIGDE